MLLLAKKIQSKNNFQIHNRSFLQDVGEWTWIWSKGHGHRPMDMRDSRRKFYNYWIFITLNTLAGYSSIIIILLCSFIVMRIYVLCMYVIYVYALNIYLDSCNIYMCIYSVLLFNLLVNEEISCLKGTIAWDFLSRVFTESLNQSRLFNFFSSPAAMQIRWLFTNCWF